MKIGIAALLAGALVAGQAAAADFVSVRREIQVNRSAPEVWARVGGYCAIKDWLPIGTCAILKGDNPEDVGAVRKLGEVTEEVMIARTPHSYTYYQTVGGMAANNYNGTLSVEPGAGRTSKIVYTLVYDQTKLDDAARTANRTRLEGRFQTAIETMKKLAEATP